MKLKWKSSVIVVLQLLLAAQTALANTINYTAPTAEQPGKFSGEIQVSRIGPLALPDGIVRFSEDEMIVEAVPDWLFDREVVLRGVIVRAEIASQQNSSVLAGLVFFTEGQWLKNLGPAGQTDSIVSSSGERITGIIKSRSGQAFAVQLKDGGTKLVKFGDIKSIDSSRVYAFNILTPTARISPTDSSLSFESNLIKLSPASERARNLARKPQVPKSTLEGADPGVSMGSMAAFVAIDIFSEIAPAIAIPLVLNPSTQRHAIMQISSALNAQLGLPPNPPHR